MNIILRSLILLIILLFSYPHIQAQTTFDFEANTAGFETKTVSQTVGGNTIQITSSSFNLFNSASYIGYAISGSTSLSPKYLDSTPREASITINVPGKSFDLNSLKCDDVTGSTYTMILTSDKGSQNFAIDAGSTNNLDVSANSNFKQISYVTVTVSVPDG